MRSKRDPVVIYVTSIGQTGATHRYFLDAAKEKFGFEDLVLFCSRNLFDQMVQQIKSMRSNFVVLERPFHGLDGYMESVRDLTKQVVELVKRYENRGTYVDEIVINTSGGTEKMSCIIKDAVDVLRHLYPEKVKHVWGGSSGYESIYTTKPEHVAAEVIKRLAA